MRPLAEGNVAISCAVARVTRIGTGGDAVTGIIRISGQTFCRVTNRAAAGHAFPVLIIISAAGITNGFTGSTRAGLNKGIVLTG